MAAMVYQPEDIQPDNWLYWTNQAQNWNSMCAECHSTNLQKNFDLKPNHIIPPGLISMSIAKPATVRARHISMGQAAGNVKAAG